MRPREDVGLGCQALSSHSSPHASVNESSWFFMGECVQNRVETLS